jgi:SET domain-containing protein
VPGWKSVPLAYAAASPIHGTGLFARRLIRSGSFIGVYEGERTGENGTHVLWVEMAPDEWVGYDGNNDLRFLNHSKTPNAELDGQDLYAVCEIEQDEEITIDYGEWFEADD